MEKLIIVEGKEHRQYNDFKSLVNSLIAYDYYDLPEEERKKQLEMRAYANTMNRGIAIKEDYHKDAFVIKDEFSYFLSLAKFNRVLLLERKDANIFCKGLDKSEIAENYIVVNKFADLLLRKHLGKEKKGKDGLFLHDRE